MNFLAKFGTTAVAAGPNQPLSAVVRTLHEAGDERNFAILQTSCGTSF